MMRVAIRPRMPELPGGHNASVWILPIAMICGLPLVRRPRRAAVMMTLSSPSNLSALTVGQNVEIDLTLSGLPPRTVPTSSSISTLGSCSHPDPVSTGLGADGDDGAGIGFLRVEPGGQFQTPIRVRSPEEGE